MFHRISKPGCEEKLKRELLRILKFITKDMFVYSCLFGYDLLLLQGRVFFFLGYHLACETEH